MLRRIRAVSSAHVWRMSINLSSSSSFSSSPRSSSRCSSRNSESSCNLLSLRVLKVYLFNEPKTYWTFAVEESLKVGTVLSQIADKLSTKKLTLFARTKSRIGRRTDKMLEPSESLFELEEKYKKKKKQYQLFVHVAPEDIRLIRVRSIDRLSAPPLAPSHHGFHNLLTTVDEDTPDTGRSRSASSTTPRLSTSHSAPMYLSSGEGAKVETKKRDEEETPGGPLLVEQPPKEAEEVLFLQNNSLQRSLSAHSVLNNAGKGTFGFNEDATYFKQGSVYGYISTPPDNSSVFTRLDLSAKSDITRKPSRRRINTDISAAFFSAASPMTTPTPANSVKPRDLAPIERSAFFKNRSADDMLNANNAENNDQYYSLPMKPFQPALDALIIIRIYASDNGDLEGPCWTLAVSARTKAREACSIIEAQLCIAVGSLRVCLVDALSSTPQEEREERHILADEKLLQVRDEWLKRGRSPYFFLREQSTSLLVPEIARRPGASSPDIRAKKHGAESEEEKKELTAIYLGGSGNVDSFDSPAEPPESPELSADNDTIDSSNWVIENSVNRDYGPKPHINWIPAQEIEKVHKVGDGGYAKVYKSKYQGKFVAVKTLKGVATKEQMESFRKEFEVLSLTNSPYLIHFYGASIDEHDPSSPILSIVIEYCDKGTVYKALNNKKVEINWQTCFKWIHQTLHGLLYLHHMAPQMVHRDIKTLNLLLDSKWNVKVADFGLSRSMSMTNKSSLGVLKGTLAYCAPEIHKGMLFTPKSDTYSVSIVMWELITRCITGTYHAPYSEYNDIYHDFQIIFLTATQNRRPTIPPKTPQPLKDLLQQCWAGNPDERPTCDEILLQIQSIYVQFQTEKKEWEDLRTHV